MPNAWRIYVIKLQLCWPIIRDRSPAQSGEYDGKWAVAFAHNRAPNSGVQGGEKAQA